jgi:hypothetical protein
VQPYEVIQLAAEAMLLLLHRLVHKVAGLNMPITACLEQLQRSGLLETLPKLLEFVTKRLETEGNSSSSSSTSASAAANASQASSSSGAAADAASNTTPASTLEGQLLAHQVGRLRAYSQSLHIYTLMAPLWSGGAVASVVFLGCTQPAIQAVLAVLQHCSRLHAQVGEHHLLYAHDLARVWDITVRGLWSVCEIFDPCSLGAHLAGFNQSQGSQQQQSVTFKDLLPCKQLLPCLALGMATNMHTLLLLQSQDTGAAGPGWPRAAVSADSGSSSSSSSSSRSNTSSLRESGSGRAAGSRRPDEVSSSSSGHGSSASARCGGGSSSRASSVVRQPAAAVASTGNGVIGRALSIIQTASQLHAELPSSHSKMFALLGCDSSALLLAAAAKAEQLPAESTVMLADEMRCLRRSMKIFSLLAVHMDQKAHAMLALHGRRAAAVQQHELSVRLLVPALLLHFAAKQVGLPAHKRPSLNGAQWPTIEDCVEAAATVGYAVIIDTSVPQSVFAGGSSALDLQQVLLQDLLPMVEQISSAVLYLPGLAAYRRGGSGSGSSSSSGSGSGSMPRSTLARPDKQYAVSNKVKMAQDLIAIISNAAGFRHSDRPDNMPAVTLGSHVLMVGQLCEAAVRLSLRDTPTTDPARLEACTALVQLSTILQGLGGMVGEMFGAVLEAAGNAAAAEAARISLEDAMLQFAGLCCSIVKAASTAGAAATHPLLTTPIRALRMPWKR